MSILQTFLRFYSVKIAMDVYGAMLLLTNLLTTLSRYIPGMPWVDNQEVAVFMFNATLGARDFTVSGDYFYQVVSENDNWSFILPFSAILLLTFISCQTL